MFHYESESTLFGLPEMDRTRNQWLGFICNTVPEQFNPNIFLPIYKCVHIYVCSAFYGGLLGGE